MVEAAHRRCIGAMGASGATRPGGARRRPLRVMMNLNGLKLLVLLPQPVKRLPAQVRQGLARRVGEEPQVGEFERQRIIAAIQ